MYIEGVADEFVHDAVGVHTDFPHLIFSDFRHHPTYVRQGEQCTHLVGNVLNDAGGVVLGVVSDVLMN